MSCGCLPILFTPHTLGQRLQQPRPPPLEVGVYVFHPPRQGPGRRGGERRHSKKRGKERKTQTGLSRFDQCCASTNAPA